MKLKNELLNETDARLEAGGISPCEEGCLLVRRVVTESGSRAYRRTRSGGGYDFQSLICQNPCITCIAVNMLINCCCGRAFWC